MKRISLLTILASVCLLSGPSNIATAQTLTTLHQFGSSSTDGQNPVAGLVQGVDGNFYGTTENGGTGVGTVFRISPSGTYSNLFSFDLGDGGYPFATLVQGIDSNFYGTTEYGGAGTNCPGIGCGTVFRISTNGSFSSLYSFHGSDGQNPVARLAYGIDTNFYGTTLHGGTNNDGTVFRISSQGTETTLYQFGGFATDGKFPQAGLVLGSDTNFYGTTSGGGTNNDGTVFRISSQGTETTLYQFGGFATDGKFPQAGLVLGSDTNFYGTTEYGGTSNAGTVFRISPSGSFTNLYSFFPTGNEGAYPAAGVVEGSDGNFYGSASEGSTQVVFRISPSGNYTNLYSASLGVNDPNPTNSTLVQGIDGNFYGTTEYGGTSNSGTVFKLSIPLNPPANQVSAFQLSGTNVVLTIPSISGVTYQLQFINSLGSTGEWINVGSPITSSGGSLSLTGSGGNPRSNGFYRAEGSNDPNSCNGCPTRNR